MLALAIVTALVTYVVQDRSAVVAVPARSLVDLALMRSVDTMFLPSAPLLLMLVLIAGAGAGEPPCPAVRVPLRRPARARLGLC